MSRDKFEEILDNYTLLNKVNDDIIKQVTKLNIKLDSEIDALSEELFSKRDLLTVMSRVELPADQQPQLLIASKIKQYCNWHYPALQINCNY